MSGFTVEPIPGGKILRRVPPHVCPKPGIEKEALAEGDRFLCDCGVGWEVAGVRGVGREGAFEIVLIWRKV